MTIYRSGVLTQFKIQLLIDAKGSKLYPMYIWGQVAVNLVPTEYFPHLRQITTHFQYKNLDKKDITLLSQDRKKISSISHVQCCKYFNNVECFNFNACISLEPKSMDWS